MFANCTRATTIAITIASEKEITVSGMVTVKPCMNIFGKESINRFHNRPLNIKHPLFLIKE